MLVTWVGRPPRGLRATSAPGELVAFYGYAGFLVIPLRTSAESVEKFTRALIGAKRMLQVLAVERTVVEPDAPVAEPPAGVALTDPTSGLRVEPGGLDMPRLRFARRDRPPSPTGSGG